MGVVVVVVFVGVGLGWWCFGRHRDCVKTIAAAAAAQNGAPLGAPYIYVLLQPICPSSTTIPLLTNDGKVTDEFWVCHLTEISGKAPAAAAADSRRTAPTAANCAAAATAEIDVVQQC